jgi:hypothetical protein
MKSFQEINQNEVLIDGDKFVRETKNPNNVKDLFPNSDEMAVLVRPYSEIDPNVEIYVYAGIHQTIGFIKAKLGLK